MLHGIRGAQLSRIATRNASQFKSLGKGLLCSVRPGVLQRHCGDDLTSWEISVGEGGL